MAKKKSGAVAEGSALIYTTAPPAEIKPPKRYQLVIDDDLVQRLNIVALSLNTTPPAYVNARLREALDMAYPAALEAMGLEEKKT